MQAITYLSGAVYAGGHFTVACPRPSRTATSWCPARCAASRNWRRWTRHTGRLLDWNPRSNGRWGVLTMSANAAGGTIAVGGEFTAFGGVDRPYFAQFQSCAYGCGGGRTR